MIDKIKAFTQDFKVGDCPHLKIYNLCDLKTGLEQGVKLFENSKGGVYGTKAVLNNGDLDEKLPFHLEINGYGVFLEFNPSLIYNDSKHNFYLVNNIQTKLIAEKIEGELKERGLFFSVSDMKLSRVDLCKNIQTRYKFEIYNNLFEFMKGKRTKSINYGGTYSFRNASREICFYDKVAELQECHGIYLRDFDIDSRLNVMRGELRLRKSKVVKNNLGIENLYNLYGESEYQHVKEQYKGIITDMIFSAKKKNSDVQVEMFPAIDLLRECKEKYKRNSVNNFVATLGLDSLVEIFGSLDSFQSVLLQVGYERTYVYRVIKDLDIRIATQREIKENFKKKEYTISGLYEEIYSKLIA